MKLKELYLYILKSLDVKIKNREIEAKFIINKLGYSNLDLLFNDIFITPEQIKKVDVILKRRNNFEPLSYIFNTREFFGREFYVDKNVLIPRNETELMIEKVLKEFSGDKNIKYLDLCTGSGCVGITIMKELGINGDLSDISDNALEVARINASKLGVNPRFFCSDLFENINEKYNLITINPPYVPIKRKNLLDRDISFEPEIAIFSEDDGMFLIKKILMNISDYVMKDSYVIIEIDETHKEGIVDYITKNNFGFDYSFIKDYSEFYRFIELRF